MSCTLSIWIIFKSITFTFPSPRYSLLITFFLFFFSLYLTLKIFSRGTLQYIKSSPRDVITRLSFTYPLDPSSHSLVHPYFPWRTYKTFFRFRQCGVAWLAYGVISISP
jgi:hypothetical protein